MKKRNTIKLFRRVKKEFSSAIDARRIFGFESYEESTHIATFKKYYDPEDIDDFIRSDKSLGFGLIDSVGYIENYYPRENDEDRRHNILTNCIESINNPRYEYYWEIPDDGIIISSSLTCHDRYNSGESFDDACGTCSGSNCCNHPEVIKTIHTVSNYHTGETLISTYDKSEAYKCYRDHKLTEEVKIAFYEICELINIDGYKYKCNNTNLSIEQLVYKLSRDYGIRVKSR